MHITPMFRVSTLRWASRQEARKHSLGTDFQEEHEQWQLPKIRTVRLGGDSF